MATGSQAPLPTSTPVEELTGPGRKRCPLLPPPEKEEEQMLAPDATVTSLTKPAKKLRRPLVPMTDEEQEKILSLKEKHRSRIKDLQDLVDKRKVLLKLRDGLRFRRRCLAACAVNRIVLLRHDATYVNHKRLLGVKVGDPEVRKAMGDINLVHFLYTEIGRAMQIGMDDFLEEYEIDKELYLEELQAKTVRDQNGAPLNPVAQN